MKPIRTDFVDGTTTLVCPEGDPWKASVSFVVRDHFDGASPVDRTVTVYVKDNQEIFDHTILRAADVLMRDIQRAARRAYINRGGK